jgi:hypothetical protein
MTKAVKQQIPNLIYCPFYSSYNIYAIFDMKMLICLDNFPQVPNTFFSTPHIQWVVCPEHSSTNNFLQIDCFLCFSSLIGISLGNHR